MRTEGESEDTDRKLLLEKWSDLRRLARDLPHDGQAELLETLMYGAMGLVAPDKLPVLARAAKVRVGIAKRRAKK